MMLLTKENRKALAPMRTTDGKDPRSIRVPVKFFTPWSNWTWYAWEAEESLDTGYKADTLFFGLVVGHEKELGYWTLSELAGVRGPFGLRIERDLNWDPKTTVDDVLRKEGLSDLADALCAKQAA